MTVNLFGYSERGMMNAIASDIAYSEDPNAVVLRLLEWFSFPLYEPEYKTLKPTDIEKITLIVEQSFSDYGDLDMLLLIDCVDNRKEAYLIEAKVKTFSSRSWSIFSEWQTFAAHLRQPGTATTSNLFVQLHRKMRLHECVARQLPADLGGDGVASKYRIGNNGVVRKAADMLTPYLNNFWYAMLVPDSLDSMVKFFNFELNQARDSMPALRTWDVERLGFLTWEGLEESTKGTGDVFRRTADNFRYNHGQIY